MLYNKHGDVIESDLKLDFPILSADEVEQGYDGGLYLKGTAPQEGLEEQVAKLETETGLTRVMREMVLAENSGASDYVKAKANEIEDLAKQLRIAKETHKVTTINNTKN